jgi:biotin operon repressor
MPKGKSWTQEETKKLLRLREAGKQVSVIAAELGKSREAVLQKIYRLGLKVVDTHEKGSSTTSEIILPRELPTVEEALKILAGALQALQQPGLPVHEVARFKSIIQGVSIYQELFADYVDYRGIEVDIIKLGEQYERLAKSRTGGQPLQKWGDASASAETETEQEPQTGADETESA